VWRRQVGRDTYSCIICVVLVACCFGGGGGGGRRRCGGARVLEKNNEGSGVTVQPRKLMPF